MSFLPRKSTENSCKVQQGLSVVGATLQRHATTYSKLSKARCLSFRLWCFSIIIIIREAEHRFMRHVTALARLLLLTVLLRHGRVLALLVPVAHLATITTTRHLLDVFDRKPALPASTDTGGGTTRCLEGCPRPSTSRASRRALRRLPT